MIIKEFTIYNRHFKFIPPFEINLINRRVDGDCLYYSYSDDELGIDVFAYNEKDLENELYEQLAFLWDGYAKEEDDVLTPGAIELKHKLLKVMEER
jgi:hypothetical protein